MHAFYTRLQQSAVAVGHVDKASDRLASPGGIRVPLLSVAGGIFHCLPCMGKHILIML